MRLSISLDSLGAAEAALRAVDPMVRRAVGPVVDSVS
jgi:hypothetical protein